MWTKLNRAHEDLPEELISVDDDAGIILNVLPGNFSWTAKLRRKCPAQRKGRKD
jgi:hypothetical protein